MTAPRVTAAAIRDARAVLASAGVPETPGLADDICRAVVTADDHKVRYAVLVRDGSAFRLFGPYATVDAAHKAVDTGLLASLPGARGAVLPLTPAPKRGEWATLLEMP